MTPEDRRLATLVALFAPARAAEVLARLGTGGGREAAAHASQLASAARHDRLEELSAVLAVDEAHVRELGERLARLERGRVADVLRSVAGGVADGGVSPTLLRLCRERLGR